MKRLIVLFALASAFFIQGCGPGDPGIWKNGKIKSGVRDDIHKLNNQLYEGLKANKVSDVENLMSKGLLEGNDYRRTIELINLQSQLGGYNILDEYYIINYKPADKHTFKTTATDGNKYTFYCTTITEEMYVIFMTPKSRGDKYMITAIYCKYDYGWKLNTLELMPYTIMGKTAAQLYKLAMEKYNKGYVIDAFITMELVDKCMRPNELWRYPEDSDMITFAGKIGGVLDKYQYPLVMNQVPTKPKVFEVTYQTTNEGVFPAVNYLSAISIKDTVALRAENNNIIKTIGQIFPGIDKDKKHIFFSAFNELPTGKKSVSSYDITVNLTR